MSDPAGFLTPPPHPRLGFAPEPDDEPEPSGPGSEDEVDNWRARFDSGLQYIGGHHLPNSLGYKPMFPFTVRDGLLDADPLLLLERPLPGFPELDAFVAKAQEKAYNGLVTLRLFTGRTEDADTAGTIVPLTPVLSDDSVIGATNWHCVYDKEYGQPETVLYCTPEVYAPWDAVPKKDRLAVEVLEMPLPKSLLSLANSLRRPSSPDKNLEQKWRNADLALVRIVNWSRCKLPRLGRCFVPSATPAATGNRVVIIATGGKVGPDWGRRFLARPGDPAPELDHDQALYRLEVLRNNAFYERRRTISPGTVHAANNQVVEHTASVLPGCSGGAGADMDEPWKLVFYHTQSQASRNRQWSWGVAAMHPVHAYFYLAGVLPRMCELSSHHEALADGALAEMAAYADVFKDHWAEWGVEAAVEEFKAAHAV